MSHVMRHDLMSHVYGSARERPPGLHGKRLVTIANLLLAMVTSREKHAASLLCVKMTSDGRRLQSGIFIVEEHQKLKCEGKKGSV